MSTANLYLMVKEMALLSRNNNITGYYKNIKNKK